MGFAAGKIQKGHLDHLLPARSKVRRVKHHAALPYTDIGEFMAELRERQEAAARALEFTILTAARTGETLGAVWEEFDLRNKVWTIPAERMKATVEHRVPLSERTLEILLPLYNSRCSNFVFSSPKAGQPLSEMAMLMMLRRMQREVTVHGFRSTFRDWAAERTNFANEVCEAGPRACDRRQIGGGLPAW
jgi:integrase